MKASGDIVQFESRVEVGAVLQMTETYMKEHPESKNREIIKEFFGLLDVMEMSW